MSAHSSEGEDEDVPGMMMADRRGDVSEDPGPSQEGRGLRRYWEMTKSCSQKCWAHKNVRLLVTILLGQALSVLLCGTGVTSQLLVSNHSIAVPATQVFLTYVLLGVVFGVQVVVRSDFLTILRRNWWKYIILGLVDLEANYLVVLAYRYTNLTTVQLLDSFTIGAVMVLSFFFLRARYKIINFMGVALSIVGILSLVLADAQGSRAGRGPRPLLGDLLCLSGAVLYAVSNVAQEFLVKNHSISEYLGFIGVTGSIFSAVQLLILERTHLVRIDWNLEIGFLFFGFAVSQFLFYSVVPLLLRISSAVVFNLSLLTADIYTLLFGLFLFHYRFSFFYVLAFILIVTGVFIYNLRQPSTAKKKEKRDPEEQEGGQTGGKIMSGLRQALLETQTFELSESKQRPVSVPPPSKRKRLISKWASKLVSKLPSPPTPADHSALSSSSRRRFEDLAEEDKHNDFFGASKQSLIRGRLGSSGSEGVYGSVERQDCGKQKTGSSRTSSSPAPSL